MRLHAGRSALRLPLGGRPPVAIALDVPTLDRATTLAHAVAPHVAFLKVGLELFIAEGSAAVGLGADVGLPVFLDLKLHDIPRTVAHAVARAAALGARLVTVHALGGPTMLEAAVRAARESEHAIDVVAVTVLTSMDAAETRAVGLGASPADAVPALARMAYEAGVRFFVCSPNEAATLRERFGDDAFIITPGVRPADSSVSADDQKRVTTPAEAIRLGANLLVVGRPIAAAADPAAVAHAIAASTEGARA